MQTLSENLVLHHYGDYGHVRIIDPKYAVPKPEKYKFSRLDSIPSPVDLYYSRIVQLLRSSEKPIVALDLGGMIGASWLNLAKELSAEIEGSRLALVVSNLKFNPYTQREKFFDESPYYLDLYRECGSLVHYVNGNASKLRHMTIPLPDGQVVPLRCSVDIVHEAFSLSHWSEIPELEFLQAVSLLSCNGLYNVQQIGENVVASDSIFENPFNAERRLLHSYSLAERHCDIERVHSIESGTLASAQIVNNVLFRRSGAPPISLDK